MQEKFENYAFNSTKIWGGKCPTAPPVSDAPDWSLSLVPRFDDSFLNNKAGNVQKNSSRNLIDKVQLI